MTKNEVAPKFRMWAEEREDILYMPKSEYAIFTRKADEENVLDLSITPIAGFAENPDLFGGLLTAPSSDTHILELSRYRGVGFPSSEGYATYEYTVHGEFIDEPDYQRIAEAASTNDDAALRSFVKSNVWFQATDKKDMGKRYGVKPSKVYTILRST